jgi:hypothetical protein
MAHFAELDENNIVLRVLVVNNSDIMDENNVEQESIGITFLQNLVGGTWVQTSYNNNIRKNYAGIGFTYDQIRDAFIPPKSELFASWVLDEETCRWIPPIAYPTDGLPYTWDEATISWAAIPSPYPSWIVVNGRWAPPISYPTDGKNYIWDEAIVNWVEYVEETTTTTAAPELTLKVFDV